jgi:hypothetical protein
MPHQRNTLRWVVARPMRRVELKVTADTLFGRYLQTHIIVYRRCRRVNAIKSDFRA